VQVAVTGSADIVYGPGIFSVIAAYAKGAQLTIIGNAIRGAGDTFWYVRKDSPVKSIKDMSGRTLAYSNPGSLTSLLVETMIREHNIQPKLVAAGSFASARTQMMSGQIDTAFSSFPSNLDLIRSGEARVIATGDDATSLRPSSMRVIAANSDWLAKNRDVATRAMRAIWKAQEYAFSNPKALTSFAGKWELDIDDAKQALSYFKLEQITLAPVSELDLLLRLAQEHGFIKEPLTADQRSKLVDIVYDPDKK
jgi:NitT/TauT family transport system substrate-binding protein